ncbi:MAG: hypothetical protein LUH05_09360 [Candidatus Gastranaerophilales bacterium]|nr:hypothetical protein [Candidatus Gastranaerophilales bacterium]
MKKNIFYTVIDAILFLLILYVLIVNYKLNTASRFGIAFDGTIVNLSTFFVILLIYIFGAFSGFVYSAVLGLRYKDQIEFYARKNEKLSQQNEIDTDDKEALQRKIATLEIALDNALKNKE